MTREFCAVARPILISQLDSLTEATAKEILAHNEYGHQVCGWNKGANAR